MEATTGIVGRKAASGSAADKLKRKKKKKRKQKEGKRSSLSSNFLTGSPDSDGRTCLHKSQSAISCPSGFIQQQSERKATNDTADLCHSFNETLRWLPFIANHSTAIPPTASNSRLHGPTVSRLNSNSLIESPEEEEERIAIYKMNRRKRYLAAQQVLLDLYPDTKAYASEESSNLDSRKVPSKTSLYISQSAADKLETIPSKSSGTFELVVPSIVANADSLRSQEVM